VIVYNVYTGIKEAWANASQPATQAIREEFRKNEKKRKEEKRTQNNEKRAKKKTRAGQP